VHLEKRSPLRATHYHGHPGSHRGAKGLAARLRSVRGNQRWQVVATVVLDSISCSLSSGSHYLTRNRTRGSDFPPFSLRMTGPHHRLLLLSCALLATGEDCSWSWHGYDFS